MDTKNASRRLTVIFVDRFLSGIFPWIRTQTLNWILRWHTIMSPINMDEQYKFTHTKVMSIEYIDKICLMQYRHRFRRTHHGAIRTWEEFSKSQLFFVLQFKLHALYIEISAKCVPLDRLNADDSVIQIYST